MSDLFKQRLLLTALCTTISFSAVNSHAAKSEPGSAQMDTNPEVARVVDYSMPAQGLDRSKSATSIGWKIGDSYWDYQQKGATGRRVRIGQSAPCPWTAHFAWVFAPSALPMDIEPVHNGWDGSLGQPTVLYDGMLNPGDNGPSAQLELTPDNRFVISSHVNAGGENYAIRTHWQFMCNVPFHSAMVTVPGSESSCGNTHAGIPGQQDVIWPKTAWQDPPDGDPILHVLGSATGIEGDPISLHYFQLVGPEGSGTWTFGCAIDTIFLAGAYDIAADPDGMVALTWAASVPDEAGCDTCSRSITSGDADTDKWDNDLYSQINRNYGRGTLGTPFDGITNWWENRLNVTQFSDETYPSIFRATADFSTLIGSDLEYHIAFASSFWNDGAPYEYWSRIFHWSEGLGFLVNGLPKYRTVSRAQFDAVNCTPAADKLNQAQVNLAECGGNLYVSWQEHNSPKTTGNDNQDDCAARAFLGSPEGAANADILFSVSNDWGLTWDDSRMITDSYGGPTGNPEGACDPAGPVGDCPHENDIAVAPFGSSYTISGPTPNNTVTVTPFEHINDSYLEISYIVDREPGASNNGEGASYLNDNLWVRLPCVERHLSPIFLMYPTHFGYPDYVKQCEQKDVVVEIENAGNADLLYTTSLIEDPGSHSGWLSISSFTGFVAAGDAIIHSGIVHLNTGGIVCSPGTVVHLTGRVQFDTNEPATHFFEVDLFVADTVIAPAWDTVSTSCLSLIVQNSGNSGNMGKGSVNMDYSNDPGEWQPDYADVYMYDGSNVIGWIDDIDTIMNWSMFGSVPGQPHALVPTGGQSHNSESWADISYSGLYVTADSSIALDNRWFAPTDPSYSCGFIIKETRVYSLSGSRSGLLIGDVADWDIPGDSTPTNNFSGASSFFNGGASYDFVYQRGLEIPGYNDDDELANGGWDANERSGALLFLGVFLTNGSDTTQIATQSHGTYTADNATYVYPHPYGFDPGLLYDNHSPAGISVSDSIHDLHSGLTYLFDYTLEAGDTLLLYAAYATTMNATYPTTPLEELLNQAVDFARQYIMLDEGCCEVPGDANHDGSVDIADLVFIVDYLFGWGPFPPCPEEADVNQDCKLDIGDLTYRVDFMFGGWPPPTECHDCPNWDY